MSSARCSLDVGASPSILTSVFALRSRHRSSRPLPARKSANPPSRRICTSSSVPTPTRSLCAAVVRLSVPRRGGYRTFAVSTTEKDGVHEQWVQLVNTDAVTPPRCERGRLVVGGDDAVEERRAEQREHRQVGLPMPTMR